MSCTSGENMAMYSSMDSGFGWRVGMATPWDLAYTIQWRLPKVESRLRAGIGDLSSRRLQEFM
jgi:hypothetical protein